MLPADRDLLGRREELGRVVLQDEPHDEGGRDAGPRRLDNARKLRWADVAELAVADLTKPDLGLIDSDDDDRHAATEGDNAVSMLLAVLEGGEVESESTNDEQQMSDVLGSGDPLVGAR